MVIDTGGVCWHGSRSRGNDYHAASDRSLDGRRGSVCEPGGPVRILPNRRFGLWHDIDLLATRQGSPGGNRDWECPIGNHSECRPVFCSFLSVAIAVWGTHFPRLWLHLCGNYCWSAGCFDCGSPLL